MKLYLIRHGESQGNINRGYISGRSDPNGLTSKGKSQITRTAWELRNTKFEHVYFSPVARAKESAGIISGLLDLKSTSLDFLQEMSYGKFEGHYFWDMMEEAQVAFQRWNSEFSYPFPDGEGKIGESLEMVSNRIWKGYHEWIKTIDTDKKSNIILVSHDAIISTLLFSLLYGHPAAKDATASYRKAFMQFVHGIEVPNGSVFIVDLHAKPVSFHSLELFKHQVPVTNETISFYEQGMQGHNHKIIDEKITASENRVFHLTNHHDCLLKIMKEKEIVSSERIVHIYKYLKTKTRIHAPQVMLYDKDHIFFSDTVVVQDYQKGIDQGELLKEKKCRKPLLSQSFEMLEEIHKIPVKDVEEFWYPDDTWHKVHIPWDTYITEEVDMTIQSLKKSIKKTGLRDSIKQSLKWLRAYVQSGKASIVPLHGDFAPQNIVVGEESKMRILDFERARIGDRIWDYAYYYGWLQRSDKEAADYWCELIRASFTAAEQKVFHTYVVLFHAWTVRDIYDYKKNSLRAKRAEKSLELLASLF